MSRENPARPIVGVGTVVFKGGDVLLIRRGKPPNVGHISLPGGAQDLGETVRQTAIREVKEETGVDAEITHLVDVVDAIHGDSRGKIRYHYTLVDFAAEWRAGEPSAGSDAADAFWHPVAALGDLDLWDETRRIIGMAAALRGNLSC